MKLIFNLNVIADKRDSDSLSLLFTHYLLQDIPVMMLCLDEVRRRKALESVKELCTLFQQPSTNVIHYILNVEGSKEVTFDKTYYASTEQPQ